MSEEEREEAGDVPLVAGVGGAAGDGDGVQATAWCGLAVTKDGGDGVVRDGDGRRARVRLKKCGRFGDFWPAR
jgi:hypothetical protein